MVNASKLALGNWPGMPSLKKVSEFLEHEKEKNRMLEEENKRLREAIDELKAKIKGEVDAVAARDVVADEVRQEDSKEVVDNESPNCVDQPQVAAITAEQARLNVPAKFCAQAFVGRWIANFGGHIEFQLNGDEWTMIHTPLQKTYNTQFRIGEEISFTNCKGRQVKRTYTIEGNKLVDTLIGTMDGKKMRVERFMEDGKLVVIADNNGAISRGIYERAD